MVAGGFEEISYTTRLTPLTSLIIEARKAEYVDKNTAHSLFNVSSSNYNRYSWSLLRSPDFVDKLEAMNVNYPASDSF